MGRDADDDKRLTQVAEALRTLRPRDQRIDRDRLLYEAGRSSIARPLNPRRSTRMRPHLHWLWPVTTAASLMVTGFALTWRPAQPVSDVAVENHTESTNGLADIARARPEVHDLLIRETPTYLIQREQFIGGHPLLAGRDSNSAATPARSVTRGQLLKELLEETVL